MNLLKCPRCGEEYSPSYRRCPFCEEGDHPRKIKYNSSKQSGGRRVSDKKQTQSVRGAMAAVLGGIGNTAGAVLGGLLIGFIEIVIVALFPALSGYRDAFAFIVLILVLLVKPTGLLGEKTTEKV